MNIVIKIAITASLSRISFEMINNRNCSSIWLSNMFNSCNSAASLSCIFRFLVKLGVDIDLERLKLFVSIELGRRIPLVEQAFLAHILLDHFVDILVICRIFICYLVDALISIGHTSSLFHLLGTINVRVIRISLNRFDNVFNLIKSIDRQVHHVLLQELSELNLLQFNFFVLLNDRLILLRSLFFKLLDFLHLL